MIETLRQIEDYIEFNAEVIDQKETDEYIYTTKNGKKLSILRTAFGYREIGIHYANTGLFISYSDNEKDQTIEISLFIEDKRVWDIEIDPKKGVDFLKNTIKHIEHIKKN